MALRGWIVRVGVHAHLRVMLTLDVDGTGDCELVYVGRIDVCSFLEHAVIAFRI